MLLELVLLIGGWAVLASAVDWVLRRMDRRKGKR